LLVPLLEEGKMKEHWRGVTLLMAFIVLIAGSMGCATMYVSSLISSHNNPVLTDEIVAIGRPDASLAKEMGQKNAIAFLGMKNTYRNPNLFRNYK
jgi:hypothetical protein